MTAYLAKRLAIGLATLFVASLIVFCVIEVVPGDPARLMLGMNEAEWTPFAVMALLGASSGAATTTLGSVLPEVYGLKHLGAIRAMLVAATVFATAAGPGITGYLIDAGVGYPAQLVAMGLYCFPVSLLMAFVSRRFRQRNLQSASGLITPRP